MSRPKRGRPDSTRMISAASSLTGAAPAATSSLLKRFDCVGAGDQVEALVGGDGEDLDPAALGVALGMLRRKRGHTRNVGGGGSDQRGDRPVRGRVDDLDVATDLVHLEVLAKGSGGHRLRVEPEGPGVRLAQAKGSHVGHEVALAVEQRRVAPLVGLDRLEVVRELALQVVDGVRPADQQDSSLPRQEAGLLPEGPVLAVELDLRRGIRHLSDCRSPSRPAFRHPLRTTPRRIGPGLIHLLPG